MGLSIFTGDRKENIIKTLFRSRLARVGLIGCSIYVYRSYDFGGTLGQNVATAVLVSAMALNTLFIPSRMLRCRHGKRFFVSALPKNRFRGYHLEKKIEGSKYLGDQGYSAIDILRNYYGNDMYINTAQGISGIPASWPGYNLSIGSSGEKVRQLQEQLQRISQAYPAIPSITADGIYGNRTKEAVAKFQSVFGLPATGVVDYPTWYRISDIYVAVSRIAELR